MVARRRSVPAGRGEEVARRGKRPSRSERVGCTSERAFGALEGASHGKWRVAPMCWAGLADVLGEVPEVLGRCAQVLATSKKSVGCVARCAAPRR